MRPRGAGELGRMAGPGWERGMPIQVATVVFVGPVGMPRRRFSFSTAVMRAALLLWRAHLCAEGERVPRATITLQDFLGHSCFQLFCPLSPQTICFLPKIEM